MSDPMTHQLDHPGEQGGEENAGELGVPGAKPPVGLSVASPPLAASGLSTAIPNALAHDAASIGARIEEQDNLATSQPLFVVFDKRRIYGMDPAYAEPIVWRHTDDFEADEKEAADLEAKYEETGEEPENWYRTGYVDMDVFRTACFTKKGCEEYLRINGHNLNKPFIYAETLRRNEEMIAVRAMLRQAAQASDVSAQGGGAASSTTGGAEREGGDTADHAVAVSGDVPTHQPAPELTEEEIERIVSETVVPLSDSESGRLITQTVRLFCIDVLKRARDHYFSGEVHRWIPCEDVMEVPRNGRYLIAGSIYGEDPGEYAGYYHHATGGFHAETVEGYKRIEAVAYMPIPKYTPLPPSHV